VGAGDRGDGSGGDELRDDTSIAWWGADGPGFDRRTPMVIVSRTTPDDVPAGGVYAFVRSPREAAEVAIPRRQEPAPYGASCGPPGITPRLQFGLQFTAVQRQVVCHESAMLLRSAVARAITARSSAARACSRWSSQALRCARAALASSSPSVVVLRSTLRRSSGSRVRMA
jgi:hypothetical protein